MAKYAGDNVKVTGKMDGDTITVAKISKASNASRQKQPGWNPGGSVGVQSAERKCRTGKSAGCGRHVVPASGPKA